MLETRALKTIVVSDDNDGSTAGGDYSYEGATGEGGKMSLNSYSKFVCIFDALKFIMIVIL